MHAAWQKASWQKAPTIGLGEEFPADLEGDRHATVLVREEPILHGSLVAAV
jgi:hypothetical protein